MLGMDARSRHIRFLLVNPPPSKWRHNPPGPGSLWCPGNFYVYINDSSRDVSGSPQAGGVPSTGGDSGRRGGEPKMREKKSPRKMNSKRDRVPSLAKKRFPRAIPLIDAHASGLFFFELKLANSRAHIFYSEIISVCPTDSFFARQGGKNLRFCSSTHKKLQRKYFTQSGIHHGGVLWLVGCD